MDAGGEGVAQAAQFAEDGPHRLGVADEGRDGHEAAQVEMGQTGDSLGSGGDFAGREAELAGLGADVDLADDDVKVQGVGLSPRG